MTRNAEALLTLCALLALTAGVLVYVLARGPAAPLAGLPFAGQLPAFTHTCAFVLLSLAVSAPWPQLALPVCIGWMAVESLLELAQSPAVRDALVAGGYQHRIPLLQEHLRGVFDPLDLLAGALGAAAALATAHRIREFIAFRKNP